MASTPAPSPPAAANEEGGVPLHSATPLLRSARITTPLSYRAPDGAPMEIPPGPCLLEQISDHEFEIVWGAQGQNSTSINRFDLADAARQGRLTLLG